MLVLSRRLGEEILIDGDIRVSIVAIKKGQIRLGITAPESVKILRPEVLQRFSSAKSEMARLPDISHLPRRKRSKVNYRSSVAGEPLAAFDADGMDLVLEATYE